jgi:AraC-like DNA-binding protein
VTWTYKCKQVPWDRVLSFVIRDFNFEAVQIGEKVYLQPESGSQMKLIGEDYIKRRVPTGIIILIIVGICSFVGGTAGFLFFKKKSKSQEKTTRDFSIDPEKAENIQKKVVYIFEVEKIFKNEDITLRSLSEKLFIPSHHLSWILNKKMKVTFSELINSYRVEEVKKRLASPKDANKTILDIAFEAGFSTKTSFNRVFLKMTGKTPTQYRKQNLPQNNS